MSAAHNWAGNYTYQAARRHQPETVTELQGLVARGAKVKALGTRHVFNDIADTTEDQISLARLNRVLALDREKRTVTIEAQVDWNGGPPSIPVQAAPGAALVGMPLLEGSRLIIEVTPDGPVVIEPLL